MKMCFKILKFSVGQHDRFPEQSTLMTAHKQCCHLAEIRYTKHIFPPTLFMDQVNIIFVYLGDVYTFAIAWFVVAATSSGTFLLVIGQIMEIADAELDMWTWRLITGLVFNFSWNIARLLATLIVYLCNDWTIVLTSITIAIAAAYFAFENFLWEEEKTFKTSSMYHLKNTCALQFSAVTSNNCFYSVYC
jgi:hypothetical protein